MQDGFNDPLWRQVVSGAQMLFVAFGALVLMPLITVSYTHLTLPTIYSV